MKRRVAITGIGLVTPCGNSASATWLSVSTGSPGVTAITRFDASGFPSRIAGQVANFDPLPYLSKKELQKTDRFIHFAVAAALMALEDAGLSAGGCPPLRTGVLVGSGRGGVGISEKNAGLLSAKGPRAVSPFFAPMSLIAMAPGYIAMKTGARGPCLSVSTACASGAHAVGEAAVMIRRDDADVMIAGGAEAPITPLVLAGFCQAKALSRRNREPARASRPFDRNRDGFVLAEGAGIVVLEEMARAEKRGARIYAELCGYALSSDAFHVTRPDPAGDGPARAISHALADAGLRPDEIDYVNAHGTGTIANDRIETLALKKVFGDHAARLAVSSSKSMLGHMLGAAGAVEAALSALAVCNGIIPPTINLESPDPECDLHHVPGTALRRQIRTAMSNSFGFGGMNASLILKKY